MIHIKFFSIGKTKEKWLETALLEYQKRLSKEFKFEFINLKDDQTLVERVSKENEWICLDPNGEEMTSEAFSSFFEKSLIVYGSRINFIIGGAEGLPEILKKKKKLISLSKLTFTHQIARLLLIEQIYRASQILKGAPYHK